MKFLSIAEIRRREAETIAKEVSGAVLMSRAGAGVARAALRLLRVVGGTHCVLVAGRGNNGGDAFVAARLLLTWGVSCETRLTAPPIMLRGDARSAWEALRAAGAKFRVLDREEDWQETDPARELPPGAVVVDALLGTGSHGAPTGVTAAAIAWIRRAAAAARVLAVDLPSGMDGDTGLAQGAAVSADLTVTLAAPKQGFCEPAAWPLLGRLETVDIGLAAAGGAAGDTPADIGPCDYLAAAELAALRPPRPRMSHKGNFGHVLVIGGARGYGGAPALAALGALRAGAGLVSAAVPAETYAAVASLAPEVMAHPLPALAGTLELAELRAWRGDLSAFDVVVAGPGMTVRTGTREIVDALLADGTPRLLLDADALNVLADWGADATCRARRSPENCILTPHPGEAARLLGTTAAAVQADRPAAVRRLADATGAVIVLKGAGTLVCAPGGRPELNLTGNPGMATGGTGDVLAGVIGSLWGQGLSAWDAARLGVYLHATAGDLAAWELGESALIARDIAARLGDAAATLGWRS
ncbi:MAG: NAD(P)H-hydrate dehydratase [Kiritimatiellae bacterium]|nr:NAD(P)H-hydrate dehydratase [Kiritimatiellia bacterium]